ncbi:hypothetical protein JOF46_003485 [Paeniglutamicibacter psychrophenolicus]|uniref:Uncharacterized protein n=1 Tax=Paeniglutamicibacter psychrophenolicus TaxID=257454 RepID=A0ABS4WHG8_9MICC|nr:hypothetical protein [Paeniglutamicibacter psychrophenolicus]MBP2375573.1 hypothetical protein [Paeniglutamicibacter psychrophenolicus]
MNINLGAAHPFVLAVGEELVLPHRRVGRDFLHQVSASLERRAAVGRCCRDYLCRGPDA